MSNPDGPPLVPPTPSSPTTPATPPGPGGYRYGASTLDQPPPAYSGWAQPQPGGEPDGQVALRKARTALGWAIGAAVAAGLALLTAVVAMVVGAVVSDPFLDDSGFYESLRGEVVALPEGSALSGDRLEAALGNVLLDYYDEVDGLTCPDTASVRPSTTVVCTAKVDTYPWTGVVFFEDAKGSFVVLEL